MNSSNPSHSYLIQQIQSTPVLVYSSTSCPYCARTKETLRKMGINPVVFEIDKLDNGDEIFSHLFDLTQQDTIPNIFIGGQHVGGNSDLQAGLKNGSVQEKLRLAGVQFN